MNRDKSMLTVIDQIKKELFIDSEGNVTCSIRGVARLADVATQALSRHFKGVNKNGGKLIELLTSYGFDPSTFSVTKVPAQAVSLILSYYAFEAGERCTVQAKNVCYTFIAIGFQEWVKKELNWQKENKSKEYNFFILPEPTVWIKRFPDQLYDQFSRLTGLTWDKKTHQCPPYFAKLTNAFVYKYLPSDAYKLLKENQKAIDKNIKLHQFLNDDALISLEHHLETVLTILIASSSIREAKRLLNQAMTKNYQLSIFK
jgi:hypothetical protein